jgi:uncharacterized membrane protein HdeD (DUF308 family)
MIADDIKAAYHQTKWAVVLRGLFSVMIGIIIVARPLESVAALALVIALWALIDGFVNIVRAFELRDIAPHWWVLLLGGIVSAIFGAAALYYYPSLSLTFAVVWTAYWLLFSGVVAVYASVQEKRVGVSWGWTMAFGLVAIAGGVLAFIYPGATLASLMGVLAAFGIVGGIALLIGGARMQSFEQVVNRAVRNPARV